MVTINKKLIPIKAHYFFFMAAMGPILPQINVFGKQIGISPDVMGFITSILPIMYIMAKPAVGYLADYFSNHRKFIFMSVIFIMTVCYAGFYFIPVDSHLINIKDNYKFSLKSENLNECNRNSITTNSLCTIYRSVNCDIKIMPNSFNTTQNIYTKTGYLTMNTTNSYIFCLNDNKNFLSNLSSDDLLEFDCKLRYDDQSDCLFTTGAFYIFLILMCLGTIGFNVTNCISDAICFDMLGEGDTMKYGAQRVWGTIGFGVTALIAGIAVDYFTIGDVKSITPALIIMTVFSLFDLLSVTKLKLPQLSTTDSIFKDVKNLICQPSIALFLVFATIAGILDSFIIYYMFWHLEEVAEETGYMHSIKLIEGCVVAAECLGGEILFFLISGKILKKIGYVHCLSLCFATYSLRLLLISFITNPWYLVLIELFMQGPTYALCYTCIVAYASAIAPPGTSATVQGLVAGMDDGVGFSIGSLIGGQLYKFYGGNISFKIFSSVAVVTCILHILLRPASKHHTPIKTKEGYEVPPEQEKH